MRILANVIWVLLGGWLVSLVNAILGLFLICLVWTTPIGIGLLHFSKFCIFPFTTSMVNKGKLDIKQNPIWRAYSSIIMVLYVIFIGIWNMLLTLPIIFLSFISILGIPAAIAMSKSLGTIFNLVGKICVPVEVAKELATRSAIKQADKLQGIK